MKSLSIARLLVVALMVGGAVALVAFQDVRQDPPSPSEEVADMDRNPAQVTGESSAVTAAGAVTSQGVGKAGVRVLSRSLQDEVAETSEIERDTQGRIVWIRNELKDIERKDPDFKTGDRAAVKARADAFLKEHASQLGVSYESFSETGINPGLVSAQVYYHQTHDGLRVVPNGGLTLSFGPGGELIEYAAQFSDIKGDIQNSIVLTPTQARAAVGPKAEGGDLVLFVDQSGTARRAYQFEDKGFEVVIDAETGKKLFRRDRRLN